MFEVGEWSAETSEGNKLINKLFRNTPKSSFDLANVSKRKKDGNEGSTTKRKISAGERTVFESSSSNGTLSPKRKKKKKRSKKREENCDEESVAYHLPKRQRKQLLKGSFPLENAGDEIGPESKVFKKIKKLKRDKKKRKSKDMATLNINNMSHIDIYSNNIYNLKKRTTSDNTSLTDKEISRAPQNSPQNVSSCGENDNTIHFTSNSSVSSFQKKMRSKLEASRFRSINETLYTISGEQAMDLFTNEPALFDVYHRGFSSQVKQWPVNPVDIIIKWLKKRPQSLVVADFGCGQADIAQNVPNKVYSFDLVAKNEFVTACDMAKVPLPNASVDIVVFCLSLMGTNLTDYIQEAKRVLKQGGIMKIAEVRSRIEDNETFIQSLSLLGFQLTDKDCTNKMFVIFEFSKCLEIGRKNQITEIPRLQLQPCIYKRR